MLLDSWLHTATSRLESIGIGTARLDALVLLEDALKKDRSHLLAHPEIKIPERTLNLINAQIARRGRHEPLAYIRRKTEFYCREFFVDQRVLEPRPESETMIDVLMTLAQLPNWPVHSRLADVGAGSGAIGITAALELSNATVDLLEIDPGAIKVAQKNVDKFAITIRVIKSDLLLNSTKDYDVLLCNLPYVPDNFRINPAAMNEPSVAIFGGPDGIDIYRQLFTQISKLNKKPLYVLCESMPPQHQKLARIAKSFEYKLSGVEDFIQVFEKN